MNARKAIAALIAVLANLGVFVLPAGAAADGPCPNEAVREEQHSTALPECRGYEMVSPPDKNGNDVNGNGTVVVASADGNAVSYVSRGTFAGIIGSEAVGFSKYLARRGAAGWSNLGITPTPRFDAQQAFVSGTLSIGMSDDLSRAVVWGYDLPGAPSSGPQLTNIYSEDTATRALQLVTQPLAGSPATLEERLAWLESFSEPTPAGVSHDSRHIAFDAIAKLLPEAPGPSVYQWDDGSLRLASILPDGTPAPFATLASPLDNRQEGYREAVSPDGSRVLFMASGQLYMRVDHSRTAWVSEPEVAGAPTPENVVIQQVTGDSRHVIFITSSQLLAADDNNGPDLYLYTDGPDPEHENNLTLITDSGGESGPVMGSSDDAGRIYYHNSNGTIGLWEDGTVIPIAYVSNPGAGYGYSVANSRPGGARVTSDGRFLAYFVPQSENSGDLYLYDAVKGTLRCASCAADGEPTGSAAITLNLSSLTPNLQPMGLRPRFLADDGRVFFSTTRALDVADTNGAGDVYEFDPATDEASLLTTGTGSSGFAFADAGASGDDVIVATRQRLVAADPDNLIDLYDVRVGGGYPEPAPAPAPCEGEACQTAAGPPPSVAAISSTTGGRGNVKQPRGNRCAGKRTRRARCTKHKHRHRAQRHRAANADRRTAK